MSAFGPLTLPICTCRPSGHRPRPRRRPLRGAKTLAAFFAGMAIAQLVFGPLADRFGRRRPLLVGLGIFVLGSVGFSLTGEVGWLTFWRFLSRALGRRRHGHGAGHRPRPDGRAGHHPADVAADAGGDPGADPGARSAASCSGWVAGGRSSGRWSPLGLGLALVVPAAAAGKPAARAAPAGAASGHRDGLCADARAVSAAWGWSCPACCPDGRGCSPISRARPSFFIWSCTASRRSIMGSTWRRCGRDHGCLAVERLAVHRQPPDLHLCCFLELAVDGSGAGWLPWRRWPIRQLHRRGDAALHLRRQHLAW